MKKSLFHFHLLAFAMLAAIMVSCTDNNDNPVQPQPTDNPAVNELLTDFVKTVPGIEKYQQAQADYANPDNWLIADAQIDLERGVVVVSTEAAKRFAIPAVMQELFGPESYHGQDYGFFYGDIRRNAEMRVAGWFSNLKGTWPPQPGYTWP